MYVAGFSGGQAGAPLAGRVISIPRSQEAGMRTEAMLRKYSASCLARGKHPLKEDVDLCLSLLLCKMGNNRGGKKRENKMRITIISSSKDRCEAN